MFVVPSISPPSIEGEIRIQIHVDENFLGAPQFEYDLAKALKLMANESRDFWMSEAGRRLKSSRSQYTQAISVADVSDTSYTLVLDGGFLPYALEQGVPPYDMNVRRGVIAPLNVDRQPIFSNPTVFRTGNGKPWKHPGFKGVKILDDVLDHIKSEIIPKHMTALLEKI